MSRIKLSLITIAGLGLFGLPSHANEAWNRVIQTGELRWGADSAGGAPYVFPDERDPSKMIGFEAELMNAIAAKLDVKAKLVDVAWDQLVPALMRDNFDMAFNGLEITETRLREIAFTDPYYIFSEQITVRKGDGRFHKFKDLRGHRVGTMSASLARLLMEQDGKIEIVDYPGPVEIYKDLEVGRIDAAFIDVPMAVFYAGPNPKLENVSEPVGESVYAAGIRKDSPLLLLKINEAIKELVQSGEIKKIYQKWNLWDKRQEKLKNPEKLESLKHSAPISVWQYFPFLLKGAGVTILISSLSMALAMILGFALCAAKLYGHRPLRFLANAYIELIRGTPLLIQLYLIYYGLPNIGIEINAFAAAVMGIGLNYAAYEAEIYRAGLLAVPKGQDEAARSIGMTGRQSLFHIVLPQAFRTIIPPSTNDFIALFKDSSLVSIITVVELTKMYSQAATASLRFLELGLMTAALYFAMSYPLAVWSRHLERKRQYA
ncbi:MAG: ABC transporter permease subunit [Elusimicrobia bacterium]|nr:ABC transporter permease subunit [Elusimicrobiota bacterium]